MNDLDKKRRDLQFIKEKIDLFVDNFLSSFSNYIKIMTNKDENNQENKTEQPISLILEDKSNLFVESLSNIYRTFMSEENKEASVV